MIVEKVFYGTVGNTYLNSFELANVTPLKVKRQGLGYDIILTGSPVGRQVLYTAWEGKLTFVNILEAGATDATPSEPIYVLYKT